MRIRSGQTILFQGNSITDANRNFWDPPWFRKTAISNQKKMFKTRLHALFMMYSISEKLLLLISHGHIHLLPFVRNLYLVIKWQIPYLTPNKTRNCVLVLTVQPTKNQIWVAPFSVQEEKPKKKLEANPALVLPVQSSSSMTWKINTIASKERLPRFDSKTAS